jgi:hypothetical protein
MNKEIYDALCKSCFSKLTRKEKTLFKSSKDFYTEKYYLEKKRQERKELKEKLEWLEKNPRYNKYYENLFYYVERDFCHKSQTLNFEIKFSFDSTIKEIEIAKEKIFDEYKKGYKYYKNIYYIRLPLIPNLKVIINPDFSRITFYDGEPLLYQCKFKNKQINYIY